MLKEKMSYFAGVDLGGTKIEVGIIDQNGVVLEKVRLKTFVEKGPEAIQNQILETLFSLQDKREILLSGVGIGVPGQVELETGLILFAPNLKWKDIPLQANFEEKMQIPIQVLNDVKAITLGEWLYGAGKGCQDLLCAFIGTGIGGGIVSGGTLLTGSRNAFGEIGHMTIDFNGPLCTCGKKGCFEAFAGGWGIAARAQEAIQKESDREISRLMLDLSNQEIESVSAKVVVEAFFQGDPLAKKLMEQVQEVLIAGFASLVNLYNPSLLILGGGIIDGMPGLLPIIEEGVKKIALKASTSGLRITKAQLEKEAGIVGAAAAVLQKIQISK